MQIRDQRNQFFPLHSPYQKATFGDEQTNASYIDSLSLSLSLLNPNSFY
jgi:hypothetical protein